MRLGIATDQGRFSLKEELVTHVRSVGHEAIDFGACDLTLDDDYPEIVIPLAQGVAAQQDDAVRNVCNSLGIRPVVKKGGDVQ